MTHLANHFRLLSLGLALALSSCQALPRVPLPVGNEPAGELPAGAVGKKKVPVVTTAEHTSVEPNAGSAMAGDGPEFGPNSPSEVAARTAEVTPHMPVEPQCYQGHPMPICNQSPWAPPGLAGPWPYDEYLHDGGDREVQVNVNPEGQVQGLELEDTVAIYDSVDGATQVCPSNKVCLYAPRFAAVRHVTSVVENLQNDQLIAVKQPLMPNANQDDQVVTTAVQPIRPEGEIGTKQPSIERVGEGPLPAISLQPIRGVENNFALYENFLVMRRGMFQESEKAHLLLAVQNAITWTHDQGVQVILEGRTAVDVTGDQRVQATYRVDEPNHPCLRIIKVASTKTAKPGETVDFTIRFDNLGDQAIKRVVLIDNLTTRLEYIPGTAQSSRPSEFTTQVNDGDSLVLRWDFNEPLPVGQGGLVRFNCKVR